MTALYSTYRSQRFDDLVGQEATTRTLKNAITSGRVAHAYLFTGTRGTGKTSTARILAKAVNCEALEDGEPCNRCAACLSILDASATDLIEIDAASNRGIDEIRDLRDKAKYLPSFFKRKVYIIDEAHQLTPEAFNALLKTLEEPPGHVLFILCTTEAHKLPATIVSRCQRFDFRRLTEADIAGRLEYIAKAEGLNTAADGLQLVALMAHGSMRDAVTMLDQMASAGVATIDEVAVRRQLGLVSGAEMAALLAAAAGGDAAAVLRELDRLCAEGADLRQLTNAFAEMARKAVLISLGAADPAQLGLDDGTTRSLTDAVARAGREFAAAAFEGAVSASMEMKQTHDPRLLLELLLLRLALRAGTPAATAPPPAPGPARPPQAPAAAEPAGTPAAAPPQARASASLAVGTPAAADAPSRAAPPVAQTAPASSAPAAAVAAPVAPVGEGLTAVQARWPALLDALRGGSGASTRVRALLADAAPLALQDDTMVIGVRWAINSEKAQEPAHRDALEQALITVYGRAFRLRFTTLPDGGRPPSVATPGGDSSPDDGSPGPVQDGGQPTGGATVQAAVEILGARITDVRPRRNTA